MRIITLNTGSDGNCYLLKDNNDRTIILDCGLPFEKITHNKEFPSFSKIDLLFTSHSHQDHSKALKEFKKTGIDVISYETLEKKVQNFSFGKWAFTTFPVEHNADNWGIIIKDNETGTKVCYVTDFTKMPKLENIDHYIYEINYIEADIDARVDAGGYDKFKHTGFTHHNSLENAIEYFEGLSVKPTSINICHLSKDNGNWKKINKQLKQHFKNITINLLEPNKEIILKEKTNGERQ